MIGATPCDNCKHAKRCAAGQLACEAMILFRRVSISPKRWSQAPRLPSKDLYERAQQPVESAQSVRRRARLADHDLLQAEIKAAFDDEE
jgi:hypothetical protein